MISVRNYDIAFGFGDHNFLLKSGYWFLSAGVRVPWKPGKWHQGFILYYWQQW